MSTTPRPNVLVFFTDQQRHDTTGVHGCPLGLTPNLDRLARGGTDVHRSFTCQPVCGPARACLQTGTHATTNGTVTNGIGLTRELPNLGTLFTEAGYRTGYLGKWHLADDRGVRGPVPPEQRGGYGYWLAANLLEQTSDAYHTRLWDRDGQPVDLPGYRVDALADALIRHLDDRLRAPDRDEHPFFAFCSFLEPHHQNHAYDYVAPDGWRQPYTGRWCPPDLASLPSLGSAGTAVGGSAPGHLGGYFGMVKRLDEALGRVCDALQSHGQLDNTVILFTSDHGCHFETRNAQDKRSGHEASIRVPTVLAGGPFKGGGRVDPLVSLVDLPATLLDAAGIDVPDTFEGRSLLPLVRKEPDAVASWPEEVYVQVSEACWGRTVRTRRWKYITRDPDRPDWHRAGYTGGQDRLREVELYDLLHDPYELFNLVSFESHTPVREAMRERLLRRMSELGEELPEVLGPEAMKPAGQRRVTAEEARA
ncbi:sulfatase-like hydrolase/transferase [Phycisphaera mikurensis]|uniref:Sulfatase n=1 Tax=Phycisphaera mikurensis (strain NBRC 102666 / KCTC 22515 / FYK2301M01) TaxID=1142394 RepID=I0ICZ0_PHYMF|nr:sulfatase-like hydrolase/transferase [Phycisphaera mikurensis]MBB6442258.1 arylsulfatase A-like enzyme [Phycisphaera mikurensis]BAM03128.1 sulfatase [Phycisphaera mikurensis NBRC 102666]